MVIGMVNNMTIPECVIGQDKAARAHHTEGHLIGGQVCALVAVDEGHVEGDAEAWRLGDSVADDELDTVGHVRAFYPWTGEVFQFVVDLEGVDFAAWFQTLSHADGAIAAEGTHLKDILWAYHAHQHLQQPSLQVSTGHAPTQQMDVGGAVEPVEIVALRVDMVEDIGF